MSFELWVIIAIMVLGVIIFALGIILKGIMTLREVNDGTFEPKWKGDKKQ